MQVSKMVLQNLPRDGQYKSDRFGGERGGGVKGQKEQKGKNLS